MISTRAENSAMLAAECPFVRVVSLLGVHWRPALLWKIAHEVTTYNALRRALPGITDKMLAADLAGLVASGLIERIELSAVPRRSRYAVTPAGRDLIGVLALMERWSREHSPVHA